MPRHLDQNFLADILDRVEYPWPGYGIPGQVLGVNSEGTMLTFLPPGGAGGPGPANVLTVGTVDEGETASATITGISPAQVLNLVLPKGAKGDPGSQGTQGIKGDPGVPGVPGPQGPGTTPDEYGDLSEAKIAEIQAANVPWIFIVNPNGDDRTNPAVPIGIAGNMSGHMLSWSPANGWVDYGMWTGVQGPQGPAGTPGVAGVAGPAPNIVIGTVTTGIPNVSVSGTSPNYTLNFVLPPGTEGPQGPAGSAGPKYIATYGTVATSSISFADGQPDMVSRTVTGATTWTFIGAPGSGQVQTRFLELTNGGSGAQTWPTSVKWEGGIAPELTAVGLDILAFYTHDGGTTYRGVLWSKDNK